MIFLIAFYPYYVPLLVKKATKIYCVSDWGEFVENLLSKNAYSELIAQEYLLHFKSLDLEMSGMCC